MLSRTAALLTVLPLALAGCGDDGTTAAPSPRPSAVPSPTGAPSPTPTSTTTARALPATPEEAAGAFVSAVSDGDPGRAYDLLAEASQDEIGGREGLTGVQSGLAEGFGSYAGTDPQLLVTELGPGAGVITLAAEVTAEGMTDFRTATLPFRRTDGGVALEPFARADAQPEFVSPQRRGAVAPGGEVQVVVPVAEEVVVTVDGEPLETTSEGVDGDQQRLTAAAPDDLQVDRTYVLTVGWLDAQGRIGAGAIPFTTG